MAAEREPKGVRRKKVRRWKKSGDGSTSRMESPEKEENWIIDLVLIGASISSLAAAENMCSVPSEAMGKKAGDLNGSLTLSRPEN